MAEITLATVEHTSQPSLPPPNQSSHNAEYHHHHTRTRTRRVVVILPEEKLHTPASQLNNLNIHWLYRVIQ